MVEAKEKSDACVPMLDLVKKYSSIPATSVTSEQLSSKAGEYQRRNRLYAKNVNFIYINLIILEILLTLDGTLLSLVEGGSDGLS